MNIIFFKQSAQIQYVSSISSVRTLVSVKSNLLREASVDGILSDSVFWGLVKDVGKKTRSRTRPYRPLEKAIRFRGQFFQNEFARRAAFLFLRVKLGPWGEL